jgi:hypothetical protein
VINKFDYQSEPSLQSRYTRDRYCECCRFLCTYDAVYCSVRKITKKQYNEAITESDGDYI